MRGYAQLSVVAVGWVTLLAGCSDGSGSTDARQIYIVEGFDQPESVQYDPEQDVYFVSNMAGFGSVKDGLGYISRFAADRPERSSIFAQGGLDGVTLHAPKGMALQGDTLWVADIDVVRGFDRHTGESLAQIDLAPHGAVLLNAIATTPDGTLYVTDSGIIMSPKGVVHSGGEKIFGIAPGGAISVIASGTELRYPNGIRWDQEEDRLVIASFHPFVGEAYALDPDGGARTTLARGGGRFDGIAVLADGRLLVSSWSDSSLYAVDNRSQERIVRNLWQPADFAIDTRRDRVAIPLVISGQVGIWEIPDR